jgi:hypothetical protein
LGCFPLLFADELLAGCMQDAEARAKVLRGAEQMF